MKYFIERKMDEIYNDFINELDENGTCCNLKNLRFNEGFVPDYNQLDIQRFYLLRYFPAYLIEYYAIYKMVIITGFLEEYNVLSIGSGCGVDYYALYYALEEQTDHICYTGIDRIDWSYRENLDNENYYFENIDIDEWDSLDWDGYNVIIFPKSIGEFSSETFEKLLAIFENSNFKNNRLIIISSLRDKSDSSDISRIKKIINVLENEHGYKCLDNRENYTYFKENVGLKKYFPEFTYPDYIMDFLKNIIENCSTYKSNDEVSCYYNCKTLVTRNPILKTGHIKFQILKLERNT